MKTNCRGAIDLALVAIIAGAVALGVWVFKPKAIDGDSRRAQASTQATQRLEVAASKQGAEAAASVAKIGEANSTAPESREKEFIEKEVQVAMTKLPTADPKALIEAERRRVAVLEGRVGEISRLYSQALQHSQQLQKERDEALLERRKVDDQLAEVAALRLGETRQRNQMLLVLGMLGAVVLYLKFTHLSPGAVRRAVTDLRNKTYSDPVTAIDVVASPLQQSYINFLSRFNNKPPA